MLINWLVPCHDDARVSDLLCCASVASAGARRHECTTVTFWWHGSTAVYWMHVLAARQHHMAAGLHPWTGLHLDST